MPSPYPWCSFVIDRVHRFISATEWKHRFRSVRWLSPRIVFSFLALVVVAGILLSPSDEVAPVYLLTTHSASAFGARGLLEVLQRLGWRATQRDVPFRSRLDTSTVYAVLDPPADLTSSEVGEVLDAVRRGAGLLVVPRTGTMISDSLKIGTRFSSMPMVVDSSTSSGGLEGDDGLPIDMSEGLPPFLESLRPLRRSRSDSTKVPFPSDALHFVTLRAGRGRREPGVLGLRYGSGRIALLADRRMLQNGMLRRGPSATLAVRLVEWLSAGREATVSFDEFHQGYGVHPSLPRTLWRALVTTPPGRLTIQAMIAALLLLVAAGARPLAPTARATIERRSPLEHVGALSRAYQQIGATRIATRQLVRGLRRRHPQGAVSGGGGDESAYLRGLSTRYPEVADDVTFLVGASARQLPAEDFPRVGAAIDHIERVMSQ